MLSWGYCFGKLVDIYQTFYLIYASNELRVILCLDSVLYGYVLLWLMYAYFMFDEMPQRVLLRLDVYVLVMPLHLTLSKGENSSMGLYFLKSIL